MNKEDIDKKYEELCSCINDGSLGEGAEDTICLTIIELGKILSSQLNDIYNEVVEVKLKLETP